MHISLEDSLRKLRTDYIDIFYVHWWDYTSSVEEIMNGLHHLVAQGKVLYLVSSFSLARFYASETRWIGYFGHACMDCLQGQQLRTDDWKNAVRNLSRFMEHSPTRFRAGYYSHGQERRSALHD